MGGVSPKIKPRLDRGDQRGFFALGVWMVPSCLVNWKHTYLFRKISDPLNGKLFAFGVYECSGRITQLLFSFFKLLNFRV
jgi:hypothetical protein